MKKRLTILPVTILIAALLSACQTAATPTPGFGNGFGNSAGGAFFSGTRPANFTPGARGMLNRATATPTLEPTEAATSTPTPTPDPTAGAVKTAQDYAAALQNGDFSTASKLVSAFSLMVAKMTASDAADALAQQKVKWSGFQVKEGQVFNDPTRYGSGVLRDQTALVHVLYQLTSPDPKTGKDVTEAKDELWPFRLENKQWLYNWNNVIDFKTLGFDSQFTAGLTMTPLQMTRYSDRISLTVLAQNSSNESIVIGQTNQILATFYFGDQKVDATPTRYVFERMRSYPGVTIDVKGLFTSYPESVEIVKYKDYKVAPWFNFTLGG
ncbi:MAG: hypothetical protein M1281_05980 [Chloroflexi bacterium]|nr:hypothetical protein [Chloroflexota bacterium]